MVPACTVSLSQAKSPSDGAGCAVVGLVVVDCAEVVGWADVVGCADVAWPEVGLVVDGFVLVDVGTGFVVSRPEVGFAEVGCEVPGSEDPGVDGFVVVGSGVP